jgi:hypothetical protein
LAAIARPGAFPNLSTLDLESSLKRKASAEEVTRFLSELRLPRLRDIRLDQWPVGDAGAKALAANPTLANLTRLDLRQCQIGPAGAAALFASPHLQRLVELRLDFNKVGKAAEALLDPALMPDLCECWLDDSRAAKLKEQISAARGNLVVH